MKLVSEIEKEEGVSSPVKTEGIIETVRDRRYFPIKKSLIPLQ